MMRSVLQGWFGLFLSVWFAAQSSAADPVMRAHCLDVGQGACTLFEFPCGAVLVDTGAQDEAHVNKLGEYLRTFFHDRPHLNNTLDAVFITHPHIDHTKGLKKVTEVCRVRNYLDNGWTASPDGSPTSGDDQVKWIRKEIRDGALQTRLREIQDDEIEALPHKHGLTDDAIDPVRCSNCDPKIVVLSGGLTENPSWADEEFQDLNNHSLVIRIDFGQSSFLVIGDLEAPAQQSLVRYYNRTRSLDTDVYVVGHHGSHNGTTPSLLAKATPEIAVMGVGKWDFGKNPYNKYSTFAYGHPREVTLDLLEGRVTQSRASLDIVAFEGQRRPVPYRLTKAIYGTGWDGNVIIEAKLDGTKAIRTERAFSIPPNFVNTRSLLVDRGPPAPGEPFDSVRELRHEFARADRAAGTTDVRPADSVAPRAAAAPYAWNKSTPEKVPASGGNGKTVLFDVSHGGTQGGADWVIDGGFSDFADALVREGFTVREYRGVDKNGDGVIRFFDDRDPGAANVNEAVIEWDAIRSSDVIVLAESNRPFTQAEYATLKRYVDEGHGIFFIADHYNADRNYNTWDATEVFNGYNRSTLPAYNMRSPYADHRNPQDPEKGWLAKNFGLRFRFNAIDYKRGASDVVRPADSEGVTEGAGPVLVAAGATMAIVDPKKAKGVVYLANSDHAVSWSKAVEGGSGGLYFGGKDEGPVVAISKPSAGKAAFLGDSSPVEDTTGKYRREDNGSAKNANLHPGWTDPGNAAKLAVNIVKWLAKKESYVGFDGTNGHTQGVKTPNPLASIERDDPAGGRPWSNPMGGYDPWNAATFKPGSYGAPFGPGGGGGSGGSPGGGTTGAAIRVADALRKNDGTRVTVKGTVQGPFNGNFGLRLADSIGAADYLAIQIPPELRESFNPQLNPAIRGKQVIVVGTRATYAEEKGLKSVQSITVATP